MPSVLIIDDESNIRRMVGALLVAEGYEVRDAHDGAGGLSRALEAEPDALLLDLMIPGELDGMATLARVRESLPDVPVIMMSGRAGLSDAVKATKLGAFNFLEKPLRACCSRCRRRWSCVRRGERRERCAPISD